MTFVEKTGRTLDEAIDAALAELDTDRSSVDIEVLAAPSRGFLGLGARDAKVRVTRALSALEEMEAVFAESQQRKAAPKKTAAPQPKAVAKPETSPVQPQKPVSKPVAAKPAAVVAVQVKIVEEPKPVVEDNGISAAAEGKKFLTELLAKMKVKEFAVEMVNDADGYVRLNVIGKDLGVLIGKHGYNLDSLQYLTNLIGNRDASTKRRFILDVEGYRVRRAETLTRLALDLANKVKRARKAMAFEPMSPHERKVIHSALQNDRFVTTHSEGEEPNRKIVISPKNTTPAPSRPPLRPNTYKPRPNNQVPQPVKSAPEHPSNNVATNTLVK
ncbi:MAG: RNA-binding cell elongation regulator Jag/EloR [Negativicutes bacterium]|jgi:spoIIIJ-associated protein